MGPMATHSCKRFSMSPLNPNVTQDDVERPENWWSKGRVVTKRWGGDGNDEVKTQEPLSLTYALGDIIPSQIIGFK